MTIGMLLKDGDKKTKEERQKQESLRKKLPEEVELIVERNKLTEEEYRDWLKNKKSTEELLGKSTLIIGVRGKEGIVLGGDTKVMRGGEIDFTKKIQILTIQNNAPIIFAVAGIIGVIDDFLQLFERTLRSERVSSLISIKIIAEDLVKQFEERYAPRLLQSPMSFIFGGLSNLTNGRALLYEVGSPGFGQQVKYFECIGHGAPYARTIAKYLFPRKDTLGGIAYSCRELVPRVAACIHWVGEGGEIDDYVGGDPQLVFIQDNKPATIECEFDRSKVTKKVRTIKDTLRNIHF